MNDLENRLAHVERLLAAMGGSPEGWEFTDEVTEGDPSGFSPTRCACGHVIRWEYHWTHQDGQRKLVTGSVCVESLPNIDPSIVEAMRASLKAVLEAKAEEARKAKKAQEDARVQALRAELQGLIDQKWGAALRLARESGGGWLPPDIYYKVKESEYYRHELSLSQHLKTARGQAARLEGAIKALKARYPELTEDRP
jgi:hypothetical protein